MTCITCGQTIEEQNLSFIICPSCGTVNAATVSPTPPPAPAQEFPAPPPSHWHDNQLEPEQPAEKQPIKSRVWRLITKPAVAISLVVSVLLITGTVFALQATRSKPATKVSPPTATSEVSKKPAVVNKAPAKTKPNTPTAVSNPTAPTDTSKVCYQVGGLGSRNNIDLPDDTAGYQLHIIYALASDSTDHNYDVNGSIATSVSAWENWLCKQTGGKILRLDTHNGKLDVTFVRFATSENVIETGSDLPWATDPTHNPYIREDIQIYLNNLGFNDPHKLYAVYYDGTSNYSCGGGAYPPTIVGHVAAEYMHGYDRRGGPNCDSTSLATNVNQPGYLDFDILHETIHTLGIIASCSPHNTETAHVSDSPSDLMYSGSAPWGIPNLVLDYNRDDYYNAGVPGCLDLGNSAFLTGGGTQLPPSW